MKYLDFIINIDVSKRAFPMPRVICKDGATLSVQAGEYLYCTPRNNSGPWGKVEVGFPSETPPGSWEEYYDGEWKTPVQKLFSASWKFLLSWERVRYYDGFIKKLGGWLRNLRREFYRIFAPVGCESVYGYVPVDLVKEYVALHGGEDTEASFDIFYEKMGVQGVGCVK